MKSATPARFVLEERLLFGLRLNFLTLLFCHWNLGRLPDVLRLPFSICRFVTITYTYLMINYLHASVVGINRLCSATFEQLLAF